MRYHSLSVSHLFWYNVPMNHRIKLVISDIDGTLLNEYHRLSSETIAVVSDYVARGGQFAIATGRNHHDADRVRSRVGIPAYLISSNGSTIASPEGEIIARTYLPEQVVRDILNMPIPEGVYRNLYQGTEWFVERPEVIFTDHYVEGDLVSQIVDFEEILHRPTEKLFFTSMDFEPLSLLKEQIERDYGDVVNVTFSMRRCLEVMSKSVNKGVAVRQVAARLGLQMDEVAAFGDGMNDFEMLDAAGIGYIMGNGNPTLKSRLPHLEVIDSHSEHGVAKKIAQLFDIKFPGG